MEDKNFHYMDDNFAVDIEESYDGSFNYDISLPYGDYIIGKTNAKSAYSAASDLLVDVNEMLASLTAIHSELQEYRRKC